jgi:hypothetical protein
MYRFRYFSTSTRALEGSFTKLVATLAEAGRVAEIDRAYSLSDEEFLTDFLPKLIAEGPDRGFDRATLQARLDAILNGSELFSYCCSVNVRDIASASQRRHVHDGLRSHRFARTIEASLTARLGPNRSVASQAGETPVLIDFLRLKADKGSPLWVYEHGKVAFTPFDEQIARSSVHALAEIERIDLYIDVRRHAALAQEMKRAMRELLGAEPIEVK